MGNAFQPLLRSLCGDAKSLVTVSWKGGSTTGIVDSVHDNVVHLSYWVSDTYHREAWVLFHEILAVDVQTKSDGFEWRP